MAGENLSLADQQKADADRAEQLRQEAEGLRAQLVASTAALAEARAQARDSAANAAAAAAVAAAQQQQPRPGGGDAEALQRTDAELAETRALLRKAEAVSLRCEC